jgi:hypothetical protein
VNNENVPITNPVASLLYSHPDIYPLPNHAPSPGSPISNDYVGPMKTHNYNDVRLDYELSDKDNFFGSYSQSVAGTTQTNSLAITFPGASYYPTRGFSINFVHTFTPSLLNGFRVRVSARSGTRVFLTTPPTSLEIVETRRSASRAAMKR